MEFPFYFIHAVKKYTNFDFWKEKERYKIGNSIEILIISTGISFHFVLK